LPDYLLAIDQGTTSTRAILFDAALTPVASAQQEFTQVYPAPGLVEHDPEDIWSTTLATVRAAIARAGADANDIAALGITNQRETTVVWERATGRPIHNAIVWQDRRTADACAALRQGGHEPAITARTGLVLDPYFSATKIAWLLDHVEGARAAAQKGELAFGTVDSFLLWRLTGGRVHATDATNAARTLLMDIHSGSWDAGLCELFGIPNALLPPIRDCADDFGTTDLFGGPIRILGLAGDQHAATCPPLSGSARLGGMRKRAAPYLGSPVSPAWPSLRARRSRRLATRPATCSRPCAPTGRGPARTQYYGSTAAWRRAMSPCNSWPTFWRRRSIALW